MMLFVLLACTGEEAETYEAPAITWLTPADGDTVTAGDVECSLVIDGFTLEDPAKHSEGGPEGYVSVSVDGAEVLTTADTTFTLTLEAGAHDLGAALFYVDGDEVTATDTDLCDEEDTDAACAPVESSISLTAE